MTTERKNWWRKVALASVGGTVALGGLFGIVRATVPPDAKPAAPSAPVAEDAAWTRAPAPAPLPAVSEVQRAPNEPGAVIPAGAVLAVPLPALPTVPVPATVAVPGGAAPPVPPAIEPLGSGPRAPDAGLTGGHKLPLPPVPSLPSVELPKVPPALTPPDTKLPAPPPTAPAELPALPGLPAATAEPPKAPELPAPPAAGPVVPPVLPIPQPAEAAPALQPVKSPESMQPMVPAKPDSGLNPVNPQNTLNPSSPVAPALPIGAPPAGGGREVPGTVVDRPKPPEPAFGSTEKFVFPVPGPDPLVLTPRDSAMMNLKHAAAVAVLGGAMLSAEQARSAALVPMIPAAPLLPAVPVNADDTEKLKKDLEAANKKIETLEKQVAKLTDALLGKKDELGYPIPSDPGAVAEVKGLKDQIKTLEKELASLKTQTALKPVIVPEAKPKGIVRVVNEYPVEISMVINDKSHRIAPNAKLDVEVPAGDFSYQLLQSGAPATRSVIKDKETVTLRIK